MSPKGKHGRLDWLLPSALTSNVDTDDFSPPEAGTSQGLLSRGHADLETINPACFDVWPPAQTPSLSPHFCAVRATAGLFQSQ